MIRIERPPCPNTTALANDYRVPANKAALKTACRDKCMYCESKISHTYFGDVEHHRPKAMFPHLEFVWDNLGYVCARCNNEKSNKWSDITPFVDPFIEDPDEHLAAVGEWIFERNGSERGEYTHRVIGLNRLELLERRRDRIKAVRDLIGKAMRTRDDDLRQLVLTELEAQLGDDSEYKMASWAAYRQLVSQP
jgi:hypothetical protein